MAERRMFNLKIVGSDAFLSLPPASQLLYFHLGMRADEDGFLNNVQPVIRAVGLRPKDIKPLLERRFLLEMDGILVVKHWKLANTSKNDRMRALRYPEVARKLYIRDNGIYTDRKESGCMSLLEYKTACMANRSCVREPRTQKEAGKDTPGFHLDSTWNPSISRAEQKQKHKLSSSVAAAAVESGAESTAAAAAKKKKNLNLVNGALGKGVVLLSESQIEDLLEKLGLEAFDYYVDKLAAFIIRNQARVRNHYATILRWWSQDSGVEGDGVDLKKPKGGTNHAGLECGFGTVSLFQADKEEFHRL